MSLSFERKSDRNCSFDFHLNTETGSIGNIIRSYDLKDCISVGFTEVEHIEDEFGKHGIVTSGSVYLNLEQAKYLLQRLVLAIAENENRE